MRRFAELPDRARNEAQMLGRLTPGCEGTHGVFPKVRRPRGGRRGGGGAPCPRG